MSWRAVDAVFQNAINIHILHNIHKSFVLFAQKAMQVFLRVGQTYTTVSGGYFVEKDLSRMVQDESIARCAQPPTEQAFLLHPVADLFGAVMRFLPTVLLHAIDLRGNLSHQNLFLPLVAKRERGAGDKCSQVVQAFCDLLLCSWLE